MLLSETDISDYLLLKVFSSKSTMKTLKQITKFIQNNKTAEYHHRLFLVFVLLISNSFGNLLQILCY